MAQPTQLDSEDCCEATLPVAQEPAAKRARVVVSSGKQASSTSERSRDSIKWVEDIEEDATVPFVLKSATNLVHCGRAVMKIVRLQSANGPSALVECLKGCEAGCGESNLCCSCPCHLLKAHYISKDPVVRINF